MALSSDVVAAEFWVDSDAARALLPPDVTIDGASEARAVLMFLDWQFTASNVLSLTTTYC